MAKWWGKYFQKVHGKWKPFERIHYKYYPCPGCITHESIIGPERAQLLFRKYSNYPQKSHALYWKTHPLEYTRLIKKFNDKKRI